jgi:hydroxypyruvate isomerase
MQAQQYSGLESNYFRLMSCVMLKEGFIRFKIFHIQKTVVGLLIQTGQNYLKIINHYSCAKRREKKNPAK